MVALAITPVAFAQSNGTWSNVGTDWNTAANWVGSTLPGTNNAAIFSNPVTQNPNLSSSVSIGRITTGSGTNVGGFTISGSATNITLTLTTTSSGNGSAINYSNNASNTLTISAPVILGGAANQNVNVTNAGSTVLISGVISGTGSQGLIKIGNGDLALSGANTYTGGTTISGGALELRNGGSVAGNITNNATLSLNRTDSATVANTISGSGSLSKSGAGTTILTASNTYSGGTTIAAGVLELGTGGSVAGNITNNATLSFNRTDSATVTNTISGSGSLSKAGAGTLILSGANTYNGGTLVSAGTLQGSTTNLQGNITNNASLVFSNATAGTYSGVISGGGTLTKSGAGSVTLASSNSYNSGTIIVADSLVAGANGAIGTGVLTFSNPSTARLNLNGTTNTVTGLSFLGAGIPVIQNESVSGAGRLVIDLASGTTSTPSNTIIRDRSSGSLLGTLALTKNGAGTLDLSAIASSSAYSGGLTVNAGTLGFGAATNAVGSGAITLGGGTLRYTATGSTNATLNNTFSLTPSTTSAIEVAASTVALSVTNVISGSGALTKSGAGTLALAGNGVNTFSGLTTVSGGTLELNKTAGLDAISGDVTVNTGGRLLISASNQVLDSSDITLSGGTIQRGAGVSEVFGDINITTASTLDFGSGATGTFQFQAYANAGSSIVTLANFNAGNKLQFLGSSFNAGNLAQLNFGSFDYTTGTDGSYFTITAIPEPSTVLAAAGLLGLCLWPMRRRLLSSIPGFRAD